MNELDCQSAWPALHRYVDGECSPAERTAVEVHVAACPECRLRLRSLRREADLLAVAAVGGEPPTDLYERVRTRLPSRRALLLIRYRPVLVAAAALLVVAVLGAVAAEWLRGRLEAVQVVYTSGEPLARLPGAGEWAVVRGERPLPPGSELRARGRPASVEFEDWTQVTLREGSRLVVRGRGRRVRHWWHLAEGELWAICGQGRFRVDTAAGSVAGGGCEFTVRVRGRPLAHVPGLWPAAWAEESGAIPRATVIVLRGTARAWNRHGSVEVRSGMETRLEPGRAPMEPRPADLAAAVAWARPPAASSPPAPALEGILPPAPARPTPFEEATVEKPALVPPRITVPEPQPPPIVVEEVEGPPPGPPTDVGARALVGGTVAVTWQAPETGAAPAGYKVWRKAQGEAEYKQLTVPPLAAGAPGEALAYYDHAIAHGMTYTYRVSAVDALGRDGPLGEPVTTRANEFLVSYHGGTADTAVVFVMKRVGESWVRHRFFVHESDPAAGHDGAIGAQVRKMLGGGAQTVDFRTGYTLVDIVEAPHPATGRPSRKLVLEDAEGRRSELWPAITRPNGGE